MTNEQTWKVRLPDGTEYGPAEMGALVRWAGEGRIPADAVLIPADGGETRPVLDEPRLAALVQAPPVAYTGVHEQKQEAPALIPYTNAPALTGYYLSVFSLIPGLGVFLGIPAVVLGILGLRNYRREPRRKGAVHAWVAVILGGLTSLLWIGLLIMMVVM